MKPSADNMYAKYPRDMFFARAMGFGVRKFTPDILYGNVYTPDELYELEDLGPSNPEAHARAEQRPDPTPFLFTGVEEEVVQEPVPEPSWRDKVIAAAGHLGIHYAEMTPDERIAWVKCLLAVDTLPSPMKRSHYQTIHEALETYITATRGDVEKLTPAYVGYLCKTVYNSTLPPAQLSCGSWKALAGSLDALEGVGGFAAQEPLDPVDD
jgi:hypothetical protein